MLTAHRAEKKQVFAALEKAAAGCSLLLIARFRKFRGGSNPRHRPATRSRVHAASGARERVSYPSAGELTARYSPVTGFQLAGPRCAPARSHPRVDEP